jgi:hypothetical protein
LKKKSRKSVESLSAAFDINPTDDNVQEKYTNSVVKPSSVPVSGKKIILKDEKLKAVNSNRSSDQEAATSSSSQGGNLSRIQRKIQEIQIII